tara:strand:+ start:657 stop:1082 length:426 start_codon:yes stop_codon:yes gene_type:complete
MQPFALILSPLILSTVLLSVNNAAADSGEHKHDHGSHDHSSHSHHEALEPKPPGEPVNAEQATQIAKQRIASLVKAKAINSNWTSVEPDLALQVVRKHDPAQETQWQVTFVNKAEKVTSRQVIYVFLGIDGSFRTTNFTGR